MHRKWLAHGHSGDMVWFGTKQNKYKSKTHKEQQQSRKRRKKEEKKAHTQTGTNHAMHNMAQGTQEAEGVTDRHTRGSE